MTIEEKAKLAIDLMDRAADQIGKVADLMRPMTYGVENTLTRSMELLDSIVDLVDEHAPDTGWWKDYFILTGRHMVMTDEGWEPAGPILEANKTGRFPSEILDEVNAPSRT